MRGFREAVDKFILFADWLTEEDDVAIVTLQAIADELDTMNKLHAPLVSAFGLTYRDLKKKKPGDAEEVDPFNNIELLRRGI
jgi:hypothetical protein